MTTYAPPTARPATDKQLDFVRSLLTERAGNPEAEAVRAWLNEARVAGLLDTRTASSAITKLLAIKKGIVSADGAVVAPVELADGVYKRPTGEHVRVYHTIHGKNVQVGKRLVVTDTGEVDENGATIYTAEFEYGGKAALRGLTPEMRLTEAEAKEFGRMYHHCCRCATPLTRDESNHVGYGKTCAGHEGWWYPTAKELKAIVGAALAVAAG